MMQCQNCTLKPHWVSLTLSPMTIMTSRWKPRISKFLHIRTAVYCWINNSQIASNPHSDCSMQITELRHFCCMWEVRCAIRCDQVLAQHWYVWAYLVSQMSFGIVCSCRQFACAFANTFIVMVVPMTKMHPHSRFSCRHLADGATLEPCYYPVSWSFTCTDHDAKMIWPRACFADVLRHANLHCRWSNA